MIFCDLNCDMGEGIGNDEAILPFISSANIACGYHAGDENTMHATIMLAKKAGVAIGAHPSFLDRENFGRMEATNVTAPQVYDIIIRQLKIIHRIASDCGALLNHVKPHGALYNMAARDQTLSTAIAQAVFDFDKSLILYGLSGSHLISAAHKQGINTASEVFADRTYQEDGSLTPRAKPNALIEHEEQAINQVIRMIKTGTVISTTGKEVAITAETICLHGDGENAVAFASAIRKKLIAEKIDIRPKEFKSTFR